MNIESVYILVRRENIFEEIQIGNIWKNAMEVGQLNEFSEALLFLFTERVGEF